MFRFHPAVLFTHRRLTLQEPCGKFLFLGRVPLLTIHTQIAILFSVSFPLGHTSSFLTSPQGNRCPSRPNVRAPVFFFRVL